MCTGSPGPGAYMLPTNVGYDKHDPSKYRDPQFSMAKRLQSSVRPIGPGPTHDPGRATRFGKVSPPSFSVYSRTRELTRFCGPGPGTYTIITKVPNPTYSLYSRLGALSKPAMPAPNAYTLPSMLGPKVPNKDSGPAFSLVGNHGISSKCRSPGPAIYAGIQTDIYKNRLPLYSMRPAIGGVAKCPTNPGPAAYMPNMPKSCSGGYSFGVRTQRASPYITADDAMPCVIHEK